LALRNCRRRRCANPISIRERRFVGQDGKPEQHQEDSRLRGFARRLLRRSIRRLPIFEISNSVVGVILVHQRSFSDPASRQQGTFPYFRSLFSVPIPGTNIHGNASH
jgi:hypothetical protein